MLVCVSVIVTRLCHSSKKTLWTLSLGLSHLDSLQSLSQKVSQKVSQKYQKSPNLNTPISMKSSIQTDNSYKKLYSSQRLQNISLSSNQLASNSTFLKSFKSNAVKREFTQINYLMFYSSGSGSLNGSMNGSMSSSINGSINGGGQAAGQQRKSHLATCSSTRISIYNTTQSPLSTTTHQNTTTASSSSKSSSSASLKSAISAPVKSITRFGDVVTCCHVDDGAGLLVAGDQAGIVKVFDLASRAILRTFDGHKG